jgi:hypothetical protein
LTQLPLVVVAVVGVSRSTAAVVDQYTATLVVNVGGDGAGRVVSSPPGIDCSTGCSNSASFGLGSSVTLTAAPSGDSEFGGWSGDCSGTSASCSMTMMSDRNVGASFTRVLALTVTRNGHGTVTSSPGGISCGSVCVTRARAGTTIALTANPEAGFAFVGWSGACSGAVPTCTVTISAPVSVTAQFGLGKLDSVSADFVGKWSQSAFTGAFGLSGVANGALKLRGTLRSAGNLLSGAPPAPPSEKTFVLAVSDGSFQDSVAIPRRGFFPGPYTLSIEGTDAGGFPIAARTVSLKMDAPKEGVVRRGWFTADSSRVIKTAPRGVKRLKAHFVWAAKPYIGSKVTVTWLAGSRTLGTVRTIRWKPVVVTGIASAGGLSPGIFTCELRARGLVVYRIKIRVV